MCKGMFKGRSNRCPPTLALRCFLFVQYHISFETDQRKWQKNNQYNGRANGLGRTAQNMDWTATSVRVGVFSFEVGWPCENHSDAWAGCTLPPAPGPTGVLGAAAPAPPDAATLPWPPAAAAPAPNPTVGWRCCGVTGWWCPIIDGENPIWTVAGLYDAISPAPRRSNSAGSESASSSSTDSGSSGTIGPARCAGPAPSELLPK